MARKALAWLAVLGLVGPAGAQEVVGGGRGNVDERQLPRDIPDNMDVFRETPLSDDVSATQAGVGGSGEAGTGQVQQGELYGEVVRVEGDRLLLRHGDAVFPLALTQDTRFTPDRHQALRPGQEVRASYTLGDQGYVVNALEPVRPAPERGASGKEQKARPPDVPER